MDKHHDGERTLFARERRENRAVESGSHAIDARYGRGSLARRRSIGISPRRDSDWTEAMMTNHAIEEIVAGLWSWERHPRGWREGEFGGRTSYAVAVENELLLLDPLVDGDDDAALAVLDDLVRGRVRILVTMPYHTRSSELLWRRYRAAKARIYGHPAVATRLGDVSGFEAVAGGGDVAGIARLHSIGRPPSSQQSIEIPAVRALVFGDAVVDTGRGELRLWSAPLDSGRRRRWWHARYLPTLQRLADLDIDHVLVTHGQPVVGDGKPALQRALERAPWQRPKRAARRTSPQR